ncbi:MAG: NAD(P)-binding protein [Candidatus Obscuribacterales bacterium]|nr:NAD(P)-binding protein [Candidatus Obscuribacterales bacterium]
MKTPAIAIVGAGISGLVCAAVLSKNGFTVKLFDKGRFPGGRLASRDRDGYSFDYGAQYFTARGPRFRQFLLPLLKDRKVARWNGRFGQLAEGHLNEDEPASPRYVGVPLMRALAEQLSGDLNCCMSHFVTEVSRSNEKWTVRGRINNDCTDQEFVFADFDFLLLNMPPAQAALLRPHAQLENVEMKPCLALQVAFSDRINLSFDGIRLDDEVISWVARDSSKPGRSPGERWVIHASPDWSMGNYGESNETIEKSLLERFATVFNITLASIQFAKIQKWRFALPIATPDWGCIADRGAAVFYCGDWCAGPRVEGAYLSGTKAAEAIILSSAC